MQTTTTVTLEAIIKEGQKDTFLQFMEKGLGLTRQFKGFQHISIHMEEDSNHVLFFQKWDSKEAHQAYVQYREETGVLSTLLDLFENEPLVKYYNCEKV
ncbi:MAG: antibiotic biosynthesis monooxygenase [Campylobacteraceae bacterium]|nr:antibiotic biosynthesis monooxygenase [Campylobacteraceae bacterium]